MSNKSVEVNFGGALVGLLGIVFVTLKLCGVIDWSWWWVTLPFWGGLAVVGGLVLIAAVGYAAVWGAGRLSRRR